MNNYLGILLIVLLSLVGVIGDYYIKLSGSTAKFVEFKWFIAGFLLYAFTAFGWFFAMKQVKLSVLGAVYGVSTVIFLTFVSVYYFKESLNSAEIVGIVMAIASIVLLSRFA